MKDLHTEKDTIIPKAPLVLSQPLDMQCPNQPKVAFAAPPPPPVSNKVSIPKKERNLSPETLSQMLVAELDHFLKVEQEIAQLAEVEANMETAKHEHKVAEEFNFDDNDCNEAEVEELEALDAEIARLEAILAEKAALNASYSYSYSEIQE